MFTYIASHHHGATRFDANGVDELLNDMRAAHGMSAPTLREARDIVAWVEKARPGALLEWRGGWVMRRNSYLPVKEVVS